MKITQDVRDYAVKLELEAGAAIEVGRAEKSAEFRERGGEVYVEEPVPAVTTGDRIVPRAVAFRVALLPRPP